MEEAEILEAPICIPARQDICLAMPELCGQAERPVRVCVAVGGVELYQCVAAVKALQVVSGIDGLLQLFKGWKILSWTPRPESCSIVLSLGPPFSLEGTTSETESRNVVQDDRHKTSSTRLLNAPIPARQSESAIDDTPGLQHPSGLGPTQYQLNLSTDLGTLAARSAPAASFGSHRGLFLGCSRDPAGPRDTRPSTSHGLGREGGVDAQIRPYSVQPLKSPADLLAAASAELDKAGRLRSQDRAGDRSASPPPSPQLVAAQSLLKQQPELRSHNRSTPVVALQAVATPPSPSQPSKAQVLQLSASAGAAAASAAVLHRKLGQQSGAQEQVLLEPSGAGVLRSTDAVASRPAAPALTLDAAGVVRLSFEALDPRVRRHPHGLNPAAVSPAVERRQGRQLSYSVLQLPLDERPPPLPRGARPQLQPQRFTAALLIPSSVVSRGVPFAFAGPGSTVPIVLTIDDGSCSVHEIASGHHLGTMLVQADGSGIVADARVSDVIAKYQGWVTVGWNLQPLEGSGGAVFWLEWCVAAASQSGGRAPSEPYGTRLQPADPYGGDVVEEEEEGRGDYQTRGRGREASDVGAMLPPGANEAELVQALQALARQKEAIQKELSRVQARRSEQNCQQTLQGQGLGQAHRLDNDDGGLREAQAPMQPQFQPQLAAGAVALGAAERMGSTPLSSTADTYGTYRQGDGLGLVVAPSDPTLVLAGGRERMSPVDVDPAASRGICVSTGLGETVVLPYLRDGQLLPLVGVRGGRAVALQQLSQALPLQLGQHPYLQHPYQHHPQQQVQLVQGDVLAKGQVQPPRVRRGAFAPLGAAAEAHSRHRRRGGGRPGPQTAGSPRSGSAEPQEGGAPTASQPPTAPQPQPEPEAPSADPVVARSAPRMMSRYLTSGEVRVLFTERDSRVLCNPPCGLILRLQIFLDRQPLGPPQDAQLCRYNGSSPRYLTSVPAQELTSPPIPWKRLADTTIQYRRCRSGILQLWALTAVFKASRQQQQQASAGDDGAQDGPRHEAVMALSARAAAAMPKLVAFKPPGLRRAAWLASTSGGTAPGGDADEADEAEDGDVLEEAVDDGGGGGGGDDASALSAQVTRHPTEMPMPTPMPLLSGVGDASTVRAAAGAQLAGLNGAADNGRAGKDLRSSLVVAAPPPLLPRPSPGEDVLGAAGSGGIPAPPLEGSIRLTEPLLRAAGLPAGAGCDSGDVGANADADATVIVGGGGAVVSKPKNITDTEADAAAPYSGPHRAATAAAAVGGGVTVPEVRSSGPGLKLEEAEDGVAVAVAPADSPAYCTEILVACPPRSLSRYVTKHELEMLVGGEVYEQLYSGNKLADVRVMFEVKGRRLPEVFLADIERYNSSSPFYLKAASGRGVDGLPWRSVPPNATVQWRRMADNTLVLAQVDNSAPKSRGGPAAGPRARTSKRLVGRFGSSGTKRSALAGGKRGRMVAAEDDSGYEYDISDGSYGSDEFESDEQPERKRRRRQRSEGRSSASPQVEMGGSGVSLLEALAGAAAAAAEAAYAGGAVGIQEGEQEQYEEGRPSPGSSATAALKRQTSASLTTEARDDKPRATAARCHAPPLQPPQPQPQPGAICPTAPDAWPIGAPASSGTGAGTGVGAAVGLGVLSPPSQPSSQQNASTGTSSFISRIVATNLYIGRRQLQALYGNGFKAEIRSDMQLSLNGVLMPDVYHVQWKEGCHKGSFYPKGAPLGQLRGRFLQGMYWLDDAKTRLVAVAWDQPPADWPQRRRRGATRMGTMTMAAGSNAKQRRWLWQRQAERTSKAVAEEEAYGTDRGIGLVKDGRMSAAAAGAAVPPPPRRQEAQAQANQEVCLHPQQYQREPFLVRGGEAGTRGGCSVPESPQGSGCSREVVAAPADAFGCSPHKLQAAAAAAATAGASLTSCSTASTVSADEACVRQRTTLDAKRSATAGGEAVADPAAGATSSGACSPRSHAGPEEEGSGVLVERRGARKRKRSYELSPRGQRERDDGAGLKEGVCDPRGPVDGTLKGGDVALGPAAVAAGPRRCVPPRDVQRAGQAGEAMPFKNGALTATIAEQNTQGHMRASQLASQGHAACPADARAAAPPLAVLATAGASTEAHRLQRPQQPLQAPLPGMKTQNSSAGEVIVIGRSSEPESMSAPVPTESGSSGGLRLYDGPATDQQRLQLPPLMLSPLTSVAGGGADAVLGAVVVHPGPLLRQQQLLYDEGFPGGARAHGCGTQAVMGGRGNTRLRVPVEEQRDLAGALRAAVKPSYGSHSGAPAGLDSLRLTPVSELLGSKRPRHRRPVYGDRADAEEGEEVGGAYGALSYKDCAEGVEAISRKQPRQCEWSAASRGMSPVIEQPPPTPQAQWGSAVHQLSYGVTVQLPPQRLLDLGGLGAVTAAGTAACLPRRFSLMTAVAATAAMQQAPPRPTEGMEVAPWALQYWDRGAGEGAAGVGVGVGASGAAGPMGCGPESVQVEAAEGGDGDGNYEATEELVIRTMPWISMHLAQRWYPDASLGSNQAPSPVQVAIEVDGVLRPERHQAHLKSYPFNNSVFLPGLPVKQVKGLIRTGWRKLPDKTLVLLVRSPRT